MFTDIINDMNVKIEKDQRKIILDYIQGLLKSGVLFMENKISDDVKFICENGSNEDLLDLYFNLSDLIVKSKGYLIQLDSNLEGKSVEFFEEYVHEKQLKNMSAKTHDELEDLKNNL